MHRYSGSPPAAWPDEEKLARVGMDNDDAVAALGALAQKTRLETFRLLVANEPFGLPAGLPGQVSSVATGRAARSSIARDSRASAISPCTS
jgi:hypothetical protein